MTIYKDLKIGSSVNGTSQRYTYNVTSSVSSLSGADANGNTLAYDSGFADVYLNGVRLSGADITITSGNSVSFASNLSNGDVVDIVAYGAFTVASVNADNLSSGTVPDARITGTYTGITGLDLTDNSKIRLGTGNDLEIYHDGSNSYIKDAGTGDLIIRSDADVAIQNAGGTASKAVFRTGGASFLYFDGSKKFETTSTGATVTGNATVNGDLTVDTNTLFVDSSNNRVGIGTNSPGFDLVVKDASGACTIRAENGADNKIVDLIADSTGGLVRTIGSYPLVFNTNQTERARIDASGNLLVGKTSSSTSTAGIELRATNQVTITRSSNTPLIINRLSSDGELVKFQKDGTNIGYIGNASADFAVSNSTATNGAGISLQNNLFVTPMKGGSKDTSSAVSLGNTSYTWKDIYLGGGVFLGGTGTANKLDDYEEGTWTPVGNTVHGFSAGITQTTNAKYVKIGNLVTVQCSIQMGNSSGNLALEDNVTITGLPFTAANTEASTCCAYRYNSNNGIFAVYLSTTSAIFARCQQVNGSPLRNGGSISINYTYQTT